MDLGESWKRFNLLRFRKLWWSAVIVIAAIFMVRQATNAKDLADLLRAIATFAWPGVATLGMLLFKREIRSLLSRIRRGKLLGNEVELDALEAKAVEAEEKAQAVREIEIRGEGNAQVNAPVVRAVGVFGAALVDDVVDEVLKEASRSPSLGLIVLSSKLDRAAQDLAAEAGIVDARRGSLWMVIRLLVQYELLPSEVDDAVAIFSRVRNRIVHGHDASEDEIVRAIDSGIKLLRTVLAARGTITIVRHVDIPLFSDANARLPVTNASGIIIDIAGGSDRTIVPTRRSFQVGMRVTLNWDLDSKWGDSWYRDPVTREIKKAWQEAAEFIGRPVGGCSIKDVNP